MISYLWSHLDSVNIEDPQVAGTFPQFRSIGSYDYFDLTGTWQATDQIGVTLAIYNLFDEDPPTPSRVCTRHSAQCTRPGSGFSSDPEPKCSTRRRTSVRRFFLGTRFRRCGNDSLPLKYPAATL